MDRFLFTNIPLKILSQKKDISVFFWVFFESVRSRYSVWFESGIDLNAKSVRKIETSLF